MAMPIVVAHELLLENRGGTELLTPYRLLGMDGGLQVEYQYQWVAHVGGVVPEIHG